MKNTALFAVIVVVVVLGLFYFLGKSLAPSPAQNATSTVLDEVHDSIGETQNIEGVAITPLEVVEDSRCAVDVQCVWAGTLKIRTQIAQSNESRVVVLELGKPYDTGSAIVTLSSVTPANLSGVTLSPKDYHFTFLVVPKLSSVSSNYKKEKLYNNV